MSTAGKNSFERLMSVVDAELRREKACTNTTTNKGTLVTKAEKKLAPQPTRKRDSSSFDTDEEEPNEGLSRKEKSLGLLCKRFLEAMKEIASVRNEIHLETVSKQMGVEKRRIYDIVNVMEALEAMSKQNKSFYKWEGLAKLPQLMHRLKVEAAGDQLPEKIEQVERAMCSFQELRSGPRLPEKAPRLSGSPETRCRLSDSPIAPAELSPDGRVLKNSLSLLCRRFLMVLLSNENRKVSLDVASTILIRDQNSESLEPPSRSRCRRLYDIANVLVAMGIIRKVHYLFGTKKIPLFVYSGPEPHPHAELDEDQLPLMAGKDGKIEKDTSSPTANKTSLLDVCEAAEFERAKLRPNRRQPLKVEVAASSAQKEKSLSPNENVVPPPTGPAGPNGGPIYRPRATRAPAPVLYQPRPKHYLVKSGPDYFLQQTPPSALAPLRPMSIPSGPAYPFVRTSNLSRLKPGPSTARTGPHSAFSALTSSSTMAFNSFMGQTSFLHPSFGMAPTVLGAYSPYTTLTSAYGMDAETAQDAKGPLDLRRINRLKAEPADDNAAKQPLKPSAQTNF